MDLKLKNKTALVMGSSAGIGKAIATQLATEGCRVIINGRDATKLQTIKEEIGAEYFISADLSQEGEGARLTQEALDYFKRPIDIVVCNTGGPLKGTFAEVSSDQWKTDYQSLWLSVVESLKLALPEMQKNNFGRILLVTSIAAKNPLIGLTTSNGLRAGLEGLAKTIAVEYAASGITINLLLPGYTNTDRLKTLNLPEEKVKALVPAERLGDPVELANLACFLSSELAGYITAQSIAVDGGSLLI